MRVHGAFLQFGIQGWGIAARGRLNALTMTQDFVPALYGAHLDQPTELHTAQAELRVPPVIAAHSGSIRRAYSPTTAYRSTRTA